MQRACPALATVWAASGETTAMTAVPTCTADFPECRSRQGLRHCGRHFQLKYSAAHERQAQGFPCGRKEAAMKFTGWISVLAPEPRYSGVQAR